MSTLESISQMVSARVLFRNRDVIEVGATSLAVLPRRPTYIRQIHFYDVTIAAGPPGRVKFDLQTTLQVVIEDRTPSATWIKTKMTVMKSQSIF